MLKVFFINMTILISFISIYSQMIRKYDEEKMASKKMKIIIGISNGILGVLLMLFASKINNTVVDLRNLAVLIAFMEGGIVSAIISSLILVVFRIAYFGFSESSIAFIFVAFINILICWSVSKLKITLLRKWMVLTVSTMCIFMIAYTFLLGTGKQITNILITYSIATVIISVFIFYYMEYCESTNKLFRRLQEESIKDYLTGLNNVRKFDTLLNNATQSAIDKKEKLSLLMVDIDFFKKVNDTYGHPEGDVVLKELGKILSNTCRSFDEVSRNGGEEFSVLLLDCQKDQAITIAERIRASVEAHPFILSTGKRIMVTVSIGVAAYLESVDDIDKIVEKADTELYRAKRGGRNRVCY